MYAGLCEAVCDVTTFPSHLNCFPLFEWAKSGTSRWHETWQHGRPCKGFATFDVSKAEPSERTCFTRHAPANNDRHARLFFFLLSWIKKVDIVFFKVHDYQSKFVLFVPYSPHENAPMTTLCNKGSHVPSAQLIFLTFVFLPTATCKMPQGSNINVTSVLGQQGAFVEAKIACKDGFVNPRTTAKWVSSKCQENGTWSHIPTCIGMNCSSESLLHSSGNACRQTCEHWS